MASSMDIEDLRLPQPALPLQEQELAVERDDDDDLPTTSGRTVALNDAFEKAIAYALQGMERAVRLLLRAARKCTSGPGRGPLMTWCQRSSAHSAPHQSDCRITSVQEFAMLFPGVSTALLDALHGTYSEMLASVRGVCKVGSMHNPTSKRPYRSLRCKEVTHASIPKGWKGRNQHKA